ncbi:MAG: winged helix-turn-helix domain-containing protein [Candidatus Hydrothermarchaeaceae archaeon]
MPDEIKMDRKVFETLASETRINILKRLDTRQMTITELSRELDMAKSSIHEHLAKMLDSDLVGKFEDGHKWTYYRLTRKGRNILHPHETAKILVLLGLSLLALTGGVTRILSLMMVRGAGAATMEQAALAARPLSEHETEALSKGLEAAEPIYSSEPGLALGVALVLAGLVLGFLTYRMWRRSMPWSIEAGAK